MSNPRLPIQDNKKLIHFYESVIKFGIFSFLSPKELIDTRIALSRSGSIDKTAMLALCDRPNSPSVLMKATENENIYRLIQGNRILKKKLHNNEYEFDKLVCSRSLSFGKDMVK